MFGISREVNKLFRLSGSFLHPIVFHRHQTTAQIKDGSPNKLEEKAAVLAELAKSLNTIPENVKGMSSDEIDAVLKDVIKKTKMHRISGKLIRHKRFFALCEEIFSRTKRDASLNRAIATYTCFQALNMPTDKFDGNAILSIIQENINETNLSQVLCLTRVFDSKSTKHTPLSQAINYSLPLLFHRQLELQLDGLSVSDKVKALRYIVKTECFIPNKSDALVAISESVLQSSDQLDVKAAINILYSMSERNNQTDDNNVHLSTQLITTATQTLIKNIGAMSVEDIGSAVNFIRKLYLDDQITDNMVPFFNLVAEHLTTLDISFNKLLQIQAIFNMTSYANERLLSHFADMIAKDTSLVSEASSFELYNLIEAFEILKFKPSNWNTAIWPAIECNLTYNICDKNLVLIASSLMSLEQYYKPTIETVLSTEFLKSYLSNPKSSHIEILHIYWSALVQMQSHGEKYAITSVEQIKEIIVSRFSKAKDTSLLGDALVNTLGPEKVVRNIYTKEGAFFPCIVKVNIKSKELVDIGTKETDSDDIILLEDLPTTEDERLINIMLSKNRRFLMTSETTMNGRLAKMKNTMEELYGPVIIFNEKVINSIQENLRGSYIVGEIRLLIDELLKSD